MAARRETIEMNHDETDWTMVSLTSIVQAMMAEQYWDPAESDTGTFDTAIENDDPLALAISNVLSRERNRTRVRTRRHLGRLPG